ncbi:hypothetical protein IWQ60_002212 [Tieghemiomyces parasiticus]|uniref:Uncharacterized protein n=1 Tax=Tieghemiomyces parasiticus TaxID=78921 RepID=A0A9W8AFK5_9FUNG|nr:hypothetical protein IWQ60_002212 [Tieghemiomyces parasiticus]
MYLLCHRKLTLLLVFALASQAVHAQSGDTPPTGPTGSVVAEAVPSGPQAASLAPSSSSDPVSAAPSSNDPVSAAQSSSSSTTEPPSGSVTAITSAVATTTSSGLYDTPPPGYLDDTSNHKKIAQYFSAFTELHAGQANDTVINLCGASKGETLSLPRGFVNELMQYGSGRAFGSIWLTIFSGVTETEPYGCYITGTKMPLGQRGGELYPFTSAASADFEMGQKVYVEFLVGMKLANGEIHNGCLSIEGQFTEPGSIGIYVFSQSNTKYFADFNKLPSHKAVLSTECWAKDTYDYSDDPTVSL